MHSISNNGKDSVRWMLDALIKYDDSGKGKDHQSLRLLKSLMVLNHLISREEDEKRLLKDACNILHKECGYQFIWIGFIQEGFSKFLPVARAGLNKKKTNFKSIHCGPEDAPDKGEGSSGTSSPDLRLEFWKEPQVKGFPSCVDLPLVVDGHVHGVLIVQSNRSDAFGEKEMDLLTQFSDSIAYALSSLRARKRCRELETALKKLEKRYDTLAENTVEGIVLMDDGVISFANPQAEEILGLNEEELKSRSFEEVIHPVDKKRVSEWHLKQDGGGTPRTYSFRIWDRCGKTKWVELRSIRLPWNEDHTSMNFLRDITGRKVAEREAKMSQLKFRIDEGNIYTVKEKSMFNSLELFNQLIELDYHGFIISRTPREKFESLNDDCDFCWISEREIANSIFPDPEKINSFIEDLSGMVILVDRLEYLKIHNGFMKTLKFIQSLRETAYLNGHIVILPIDPNTLSERELRLIEKETIDLERKDEFKLSNDHLRILKFIYNENKAGRKPSYTEVEKAAGITKPTVRKRVRKLVNSGYLIQSNTGRAKSLELAERSRKLLI